MISDTSHLVFDGPPIGGEEEEGRRRRRGRGGMRRIVGRWREDGGGERGV